MNVSLYIAFILATAVLVLIPGPTVMVVTSKSLRYGVRSGLMTVAGSTMAGALHLAIVIAGLAYVVVFVSGWFEWIRWIGVAYLLYLGIKAWVDSTGNDNTGAEEIATPRGHRDFADGFLVTLTNPKALLFLGAFLPQFVDPAIPGLPQLMILAITYLIVVATLDSCWALLAASLRRFLSKSTMQRIAERVSGTLLIGAGATLALIRRTGQ